MPTELDQVWDCLQKKAFTTLDTVVVTMVVDMIIDIIMVCHSKKATHIYLHERNKNNEEGNNEENQDSTD